MPGSADAIACVEQSLKLLLLFAAIWVMVQVSHRSPFMGLSQVPSRQNAIDSISTELLAGEGLGPCGGAAQHKNPGAGAERRLARRGRKYPPRVGSR